MKKWIKKSPEKGDHIMVQMNGFSHHGLVSELGTVIHYASESGFSITEYYKLKIVETDISIFSQGKEVFVRVYSKKEIQQKYPAAQIVKNARKAIGTGNYDILYNNCEHFVYRCTLGFAKSEIITSLISKRLKTDDDGAFKGQLGYLYKSLRLLGRS
ncbi:MAG: lecithin retinol acyltransferase family protein [Ignavibacteriaceae bacterium]|nr:lecithin retinol acyltransferase family protein [Ignavibacteriaceae bacterium]